MAIWKKILELDSNRTAIAGSGEELCSAIKCGADLRIYTEFRHNEHIDVNSDNNELVLEVSDFPATYLIEGKWAAGIMTLRQPVSLPDGFGPRPSMSFFMYNQDGRQAIARPYLDGANLFDNPGSPTVSETDNMSRYHKIDEYDPDSNAPCSNFIYDFYNYKFYICDEWKEVFSNAEDGTVLTGSLDALAEAFVKGNEVKVGIKDLCSEFSENDANLREHEVFIQAGPLYYYSESRLFIAESRPLVRVKPGIPLKYISHGWDFGWVIPRSDGSVSGLFYDPYTLQYKRTSGRHQIRWFVR